MTGYYPDKPPHADDGAVFQGCVDFLYMKFFGEDIGIYHDKESQFNIGESRAGVECKFLAKSFTRLHIELFERTSLSKPWVKSGINRSDNTNRYVCGNYQDVFSFRKIDLLNWHTQNNPQEVWFGNGGLGRVGDQSLRATIHSFVLPKYHAVKFMLYRFRLLNGEWKLFDPHKE